MFEYSTNGFIATENCLDVFFCLACNTVVPTAEVGCVHKFSSWPFLVLNTHIVSFHSFPLLPKKVDWRDEKFALAHCLLETRSGRKCDSIQCNFAKDWSALHILQIQRQMQIRYNTIHVIPFNIDHHHESYVFMTCLNRSQLLLLGKFEYGGGPVFKVVLEC